MTEPAVQHFANWDALVGAAADRLSEALNDGLTERGEASLAVAGGSTPGDIYRRLSTRPLEWGRISVTLTDERWADADSPESNARLVRETLLQDQAARARFIPLKDERSPTPVSAALAAETVLQPLQPLDAVLLGMGEDGHFASLFPGSPALAEGLDPRSERLVVAAPAGSPGPPQPRLSLTLASISEARVVLLVVRGQRKLEVLRGAREAGLPVAALLDSTAPTTVLWAS